MPRARIFIQPSGSIGSRGRCLGGLERWTIEEGSLVAQGARAVLAI